MSRADELIRLLRLAPHPEGGHYRETHRSPALTQIHFLLRAGERSRWHRIDREEVWSHHEGGPLELFIERDHEIHRLTLGPGLPSAVVPARAWQAARPVGAYALVGCTVAPPFEFRGFELAAQVPDAAKRLPPDLL